MESVMISNLFAWLYRQPCMLNHHTVQRSGMYRAECRPFMPSQSKSRIESPQNGNNATLALRPGANYPPTILPGEFKCMFIQGIILHAFFTTTCRDNDIMTLAHFPPYYVIVLIEDGLAFMQLLLFETCSALMPIFSGNVLCVNAKPTSRNLLCVNAKLASSSLLCVNVRHASPNLLCVNAKPDSRNMFALTTESLILKTCFAIMKNLLIEISISYLCWIKIYPG